MQSDSVENIFVRAWSLLARNPVIVVPGLVVGVVAGAVRGVLGYNLLLGRGQLADASASNGVLAAGPLGLLGAAAISFAIGILAFLLTQTYTTGMAGAAWQTGTATIADGAASFREDAGRLLSAVALIAIAGVVLALLTFGLGWFVVLFFALYVVPAVVLDNHRAVPAFRLSARIATRRLLATVIIVVMLVVIGLIVGLIALPLAFIPLLGPIVAAIISQAIAAYATLVIVGEYINARNAPDIIPAAPFV